MGVLPIYFNDFKELAKNHRIYYFKGEGFYDFHYLVDGTIIKTTVLEKDIENTPQFFGDTLFSGAKQIPFRIPYDNEDSTINVDVKLPSEPIPTDVEEKQPEEVQNEDIQQEGVED